LPVVFYILAVFGLAALVMTFLLPNSALENTNDT
jgi:hypothetical protein